MKLENPKLNFVGAIFVVSVAASVDHLNGGLECCG